MGCALSGENVCHCYDQVFEGLDLTKMVDNILIQGANKDNTPKKLRSMLRWCRQNGVILSAIKLKVGEEMGFAGFLLKVVDGKPTVQADSKKCQAINENGDTNQHQGGTNLHGHGSPIVQKVSRLCTCVITDKAPHEFCQLIYLVREAPGGV